MFLKKNRDIFCLLATKDVSETNAACARKRGKIQGNSASSKCFLNNVSLFAGTGGSVQTCLCFQFSANQGPCSSSKHNLQSDVKTVPARNVPW